MTVLLGSQHQSVLDHGCLLNPIPCHGWRHCSHLLHCWFISPALDHWSSYSLLSTHPWGPCLSPSRACVIRTHNGFWRSLCESSGGLRAALNPRAVRCLFLLRLRLHFTKWVTEFIETKLLLGGILKLVLYMKL